MKFPFLPFNHVAAFVVFLLLINVVSCDEGPSKPEKQPEKQIEKLSGYIQKGPYLNGTTLTVSELNSDLSQTGRTFTTIISDNRGSFELQNISLITFFVECRADGFYFNEVEGNASSAPLTLWALSDIADKSSININLFTHLERDRVKFLFENGKTFADAKLQASGEVLAIFGFSGEIGSSESLDISAGGENNAKLLAISVIIQGSRSVGAVSELLANIISDIKEDGTLDNTSIKKDLQTNVLNLSLIDVRKNLVDRYKESGLDIDVPAFEPYVNLFAEGGVYGTVKDVDGNEYRTVKIGGQWWTADNLKTTHYANGDPLVNGTPLENIKGNDSTKFYFTSHFPPPVKDEAPGYGYFYTRAAVMNGAEVTNAIPSQVQGVCPSGWHVPSFAEYEVLFNVMKAAGYDPGYVDLNMPDNALGFNLIKTGWRGYDQGDYAVAGYNYSFWTARGDQIGGVYARPESPRSIRCVKD